MPFNFYIDSIAAHREAEFALSNGTAAAAVDARLRAFWRKRKRRHYNAYTKSFYTINHLALDEGVASVRKRLRSCYAGTSHYYVLLPA